MAFSLETGSDYVCSPDWPQIHYVEQAGLKLREICLPSASVVLGPCLEFLDDQIVFLILFLAWHFDITVQASLYSFQLLVLLIVFHCSDSCYDYPIWFPRALGVALLYLWNLKASAIDVSLHISYFPLSAWQSVSYFFCLSLGHDNFKWLFEYFPSNVFFFLLVCINCTKQWVLRDIFIAWPSSLSLSLYFHHLFI